MMERSIEQFLAAATYERGLAPLTRSAYANDLRHLAAYLQSERKIYDWRDVAVGDLVAYLESLRTRGFAQNSLLRTTAAMRQFFGWLLNEGQIIVLPTETLQVGKHPRLLPRTLPEKELNSLIEAVDGTDPDSLRDRAILELLYGCGLRCAELIGLRIQDLDGRRGVLHVHGKGNKERLVPYGPPAAKALRAYLPWRREFALTYKKGAEAANLLTPEAPLFVTTARARPLGRAFLSQLIRTRIRAFLPEGTHATPHTLRHAYATHLLEHGAPLLDIRDLLGHASVGTTQVYTHVDNQHLRDTFDTFFPRR